MPRDASLVHEERPWAGTLVRFTLDGRGLLREEFTSSVPTHRQIIPYGEIWDTYSSQSLPVWQLAILTILTLAWAAGAFLLGPSEALTGLNAAVLGAAWALLVWRARLRTVKVFDYDGYEIAAFHGLDGRSFEDFLGELSLRVTAHRFALQNVFEGLDQGRLAIKGTLSLWTCVFLYDRVVLESRGPLGRSSRMFFSLASLEPPIRLAWRAPWVLIGPALAAGAVSLALAAEAARGSGEALTPWIWGSASAFFALALGAAALTGAAVEVAAGPQPARTPYLPWWRRAPRREALAWFARLVHLADRLDEIHLDDYWEYHRAKLQVLREEGFIEDWPYRSALARLNSQEREDLEE